VQAANTVSATSPASSLRGYIFRISSAFGAPFDTIPHRLPPHSLIRSIRSLVNRRRQIPLQLFVDHPPNQFRGTNVPLSGDLLHQRSPIRLEQHLVVPTRTVFAGHINTQSSPILQENHQVNGLSSFAALRLLAVA